MKFYSRFLKNRNKNYTKIHLDSIKESGYGFHKPILISEKDIEKEHEKLRNSKRITKYITGMSNKEYKEEDIEDKSRGFVLHFEDDLSISDKAIWAFTKDIIDLSELPIDLDIILYVFDKYHNQEGCPITPNNILQALLYVKTTYYKEKV